MRKLEVHLAGGLGNQLFTFLAGARFAARTGRKLQLNTSLLGRGAYSHALSSIRELVDPSELVSRGYWFTRFQLLARRLCNRAFPTLLTDDTADIEKSLSFKRNLHLTGYFQDMEMHADPFTEVLSSRLQSRAGSEWVSEMRTRAKRERPICVHIRRGDYISLSASHGILGSEYFRRGIVRLREAGNYGPLWIFTDSPDALQPASDFRFDDSQTMIQEPIDVSAIDVLSVMAACSAFVISNSTFSFWAAALSSSKFVIAPGTWARSPEIRGPRMLPEWILEESEWV
jgi:Glycosyl transferase family 11